MKKVSLYIYSLMLLAPGTLLAKNFAGTLDLGYMNRGDVVEHNAKATTYTDKKEKVKGGLELSYENGSYYTDAIFQDIGYKGQTYDFSGGQYEKFKYTVGYDETIHNISLDNKTIYNGVGTANQTYPGTAPSTNVATWNTFDVYNQKKNINVGIDYKIFGPFSLALKANQEKKVGNAAYTSVDSVFAYTGAPIDFKTTNVSLEGRYQQDDLLVSLLAGVSKFQNANQFMFNTDPKVASSAKTTVGTIAPESDSVIFELSSVLKELPLHSTVALNATYNNFTNEFALVKLDAGTAYTPNVDTFKGDIAYSSAKLAISSDPLEKLHTKIYGDYLNKTNTGTRVAYTATTVNDHFGYDKFRAGADMSYVLPMNTNLSAGYEHSKVKRQDREDDANTTDNTYNIGLKNHFNDLVTSHLKYTYLSRKADGKTFTAAANPIEYFLSRYDTTNKSMNKIGASFDVSPLDYLDFSLGYNYAKNDYNKTALGVKSDKRDVFNADASYRHRLFTANVYGELEKIKKDSLNRADAVATDPSTSPTTTKYNWGTQHKEDVLTYGADVVIPLMDNKLKVTIGYEMQDSDTDYTFAIQPGGSTTILAQKLSDIGDYKSRTFKTKIDYEINQSFSAALDCKYQKLTIQDVQYQQPAGPIGIGTPAVVSYYSGYGNDLSFNDTTVYGSVAYHF